MQSARSHVVAAHFVRVVVSAGLHDVNFAGVGPLAVRVVLGHHPYRWPEPVPLWKLGLYFDAAVLDVDTAFGNEACRSRWRYDSSIGRVCHGVAICPFGANAALFGQVDDIVLVDQVLILQRRLDLQEAIFDEDIVIGVCRLRKIAIAMHH